MRIWVGTAGYSYPEWIGGFYPHGVARHALLSHYAREFPFVELNTTFYRCPTPALLERLVEQSPGEFRFALKVPRSVTHERRERDLDAFQESVYALGGRLAMIVAQFPQSFHHAILNRRWLERLARAIDCGPVAVEFRHWTWKQPDVGDFLAGLGLHQISVDVPPIPTLYPRGLVRCGGRIYARLHSRNTDGWYGRHDERHDYVFTESQLREWAGALVAESSRAAEAYVVFNNCRDMQAVENARRMTEILRSQPGVEVMSPDQSTPHRQPLLFPA